MDIALARLIAGCFFYAVSLLFLLVSVGAAVSTWKTGRFSSGLHIAPTIFAIVGGAFTGLWMVTAAIVLADLASLFLPIVLSKERQRKRGRADDR